MYRKKDACSKTLASTTFAMHVQSINCIVVYLDGSVFLPDSALKQLGWGFYYVVALSNCRVWVRMYYLQWLWKSRGFFYSIFYTHATVVGRHLYWNLGLEKNWILACSWDKLYLLWASLSLLSFAYLKDNLPVPLPNGQVRMKRYFPGRKTFLPWQLDGNILETCGWNQWLNCSNEYAFPSSIHSSEIFPLT